MPNWISNEVVVEGEPAELEKFLEVAGKDFDFRKLVPMPTETAYQSGHPGSDDWYVWRCANWGVKWPAQGVKMEAWGDPLWGLQYTFDTAWEPPRILMAKLRTLYPNLGFDAHYVDPDESSY